MRRADRPAVVALLALAAFVTATGPAGAAGYRYWSFWERTGPTWTFASGGPATTQPSDGDVEGWRFGVSADSADAVEPRGPAAFQAICAGTAARAGTKRVALVLDSGTARDAPDGANPPAERTACARVPDGASAADALAAVAGPLRYDSGGLLCAIAGYPHTGCGEQVAGGGTKPAPHPSRTAVAGNGDGGPSVGLLAGSGVVVLLAAGAFWQVRRRREP